MRNFFNSRSLMFGMMALSSASAFAHSAADSEVDSLQSLVANSDAIVYGSVVDIAYRNSEPTENSPQGQPHTFVTYKLSGVLRGRIDSRTLTLRIPGGTDGRGGVSIVSDAPMFAYGQSDVLFVSAKNVDGCPLVNCVDGRFRVADGFVYNGWGVPLVSADKTLEFGGKPRFDLNVMDIPGQSFDALLQNPDVQRLLKEKNISTEEQMMALREQYEKEAPASYQVKLMVEGAHVNDDYTGYDKASPMMKYGDPLFIDNFLALIQEQNSVLPAPTALVYSADPKVRFKIADPRVTAIGSSEEEVKNILNDEELRDQLQTFN
ncbi:MAG: hypothetical protein OEZ43_20850 [Gammaproteobacteria bacterium]|nr:hypothetical protein [Gammaproteobacteria bacterium]